MAYILIFGCRGEEGSQCVICSLVGFSTRGITLGSLPWLPSSSKSLWRHTHQSSCLFCIGPTMYEWVNHTHTLLLLFYCVCVSWHGTWNINIVPSIEQANPWIFWGPKVACDWLFSPPHTIISMGSLSKIAHIHARWLNTLCDKDRQQHGVQWRESVKWLEGDCGSMQMACPRKGGLPSIELPLKCNWNMERNTTQGEWVVKFKQIITPLPTHKASPTKEKSWINQSINQFCEITDHVGLICMSQPSEFTLSLAGVHWMAC